MKGKDIILLALLGVILLSMKKKTPASQDTQDTDQNNEQGASSPSDASSDNEPQQLFGVGLPGGGGGGASSLNSSTTMPTPTLPNSGPLSEQSGATTFFSTEVPVIPKPTPKPTIKATISTDQPDLTPVKISSVANISACGNEFYVVSGTKNTQSRTRFWWDGNNYYMQTTDALSSGVPVKISFTQYDTACKQQMTGPSATSTTQTQVPTTTQPSPTPPPVLQQESPIQNIKKN